MTRTRTLASAMLATTLTAGLSTSALAAAESDEERVRHTREITIVETMIVVVR